MHPDDHEPFMQTAYALIVAMSAGTPLCLQGVRLHSVRALHRVSYHRDGKTFEVMVDSLITATRPDRRAFPPAYLHLPRACVPSGLLLVSATRLRPPRARTL